MPAERLTPLDASFLHIEDGAQHMHVACVMIFEGDSPDYDRFVARVDERLHLVPRYRQRLAEVPLAQARPLWVDDSGFDTRYHVRRTALPRPGTEEELQVLAGRVFSQPLDRSKPLWEMWLVEGLEEGRFAVLSKTHHALVDGISGLDILSVLFAPEDERAGHDDAWQPDPTPSGLELLAGALWERATSPAELIRPVRAMLRRPRRAVRGVVDTAAGLSALAWAGLAPAPRTRYNRKAVGPNRRFVWVRGSLSEVKAIKDSLGGTVNDVMLTVVTRALRNHLLRVGEGIDGLVLRAFVPVSLRPDSDRGGETLGNQVSGMLVPLPVHCSDPRRCLALISSELAGIKESGQAMGAGALTELSGFAPPTLLQQGTRLIARQRFVNLVVTNVPGPQFALSMDDHELLDIFPMVPLGANMGLGIAILSYNGTINFGLVGDFDVMSDLEDLVGDFESALAELVEAAGIGADDEDVAAPTVNGHRPHSEPGAPGAGEATPEAHADVPPSASPGPEPVGATGPTTGVAASDDVVAHLDPDRAHVDTEVELVGEFAEPGAEDGPGAEIHVQEPWPGYGRMRAAEIADRLAAADDELIAVTRLYESTHRKRQRVLDAAAAALGD